jgi:hypothetical protein
MSHRSPHDERARAEQRNHKDDAHDPAEIPRRRSAPHAGPIGASRQPMHSAARPHRHPTSIADPPHPLWSCTNAASLLSIPVASGL